MAIIKKDDRAEYYEALESVGESEDFSKIIEFIQKNVKDTINFILNFARQINANP
ncbi:hypothetical protein [Campylobacter mucosalis]|uniref:hypothetical protein n=1 Tax=Campylobacter mucosalis TaxID=202 RepID=UPI0014703397|nr:hypothetical protein [Campylobacter mucosalis]